MNNFIFNSKEINKIKTISQKEKDCLRTMAKSLGFNIDKLNDIIDKKVKVLENKKESYPPIIDDVYDEIVEDILD